MMPISRNRRIGLMFAAAAFLATEGLRATSWLQGADYAILTLCFRVRGATAPAPEVSLVSVDGGSLSQWPDGHWRSLPRLCADIIRRLHSAGAAVIVLDLPALATVDWQRASAEEVQELAEAVEASGRVVLPCVLQSRTESGQNREPAEEAERFSAGPGNLRVPASLSNGTLAVPPAAVCRMAAGLGHVNVYPDTDGVVRSVPLLVPAHDRLWPALALEAVRVYVGGEPGAVRWVGKKVVLDGRSPATTPDAEMVVNFAGGYGHYPRQSWSQIQQGRGDTEALRGKIVIVGSTGAGLFTPWRTPVHPVMPGLELNANVVGNLLHGSELRHPARWLLTALCLLAALLVGWIMPEAPVLRGILVEVTLVAGILALAVGAFHWGIWFPVGSSLLVVFLTGLVLMAHAGLRLDRERAQAQAGLESRRQAIEGIGNLIASSRDRDQVLEEIVRWVERELDVPAVSILLMDERGRKLRFEVASGEKGDQVKSFTLDVGPGSIVGTVAASGEPLIVQDARRDPRQARDISEAIGFPTDSILCVPMILHGEVIGVIEALNKRSGPFTLYDQALLSVIANQAALFLESARLYSELQQRVDEATAELRATNRDLATQKAKIETLVDEMESGVVATDSRDRVVTWNRAAERFLGVAESRALGEPVLAVVTHPRLSELLAMPLSPVGGRVSEDVDIAVGQERYVVRATVTLLEEADGSFGKLLLLTDITQLKELDRMKTDLISFVSHELKNPLSSIKGFGQLLQKNLDDDSVAARMARLLNQQTSRMQFLVEDFLDLARIEAGADLVMRWQDITDVRELVQQIVDMEMMMTTEHHFVVEISPKVPPFRADRGKIEQVLVNLISNAVKYSPEGGEVRVEVDVEDRFVRFTVADEGVGISPEDLPHLFQRFRRAPGVRERVSGTGIGLFLSRHLVEAHGGTIWAERREKGTAFHFTVLARPVQEGTAQSNAPSTAPEAG